VAGDSRLPVTTGKFLRDDVHPLSTLQLHARLRTLLLNDDLLAGADETLALLAHPVERGLQLLLGLDGAWEVAGDADGDDTLTVDDAP